MVIELALNQAQLVDGGLSVGYSHEVAAPALNQAFASVNNVLQRWTRAKLAEAGEKGKTSFDRAAAFAAKPAKPEIKSRLGKRNRDEDEDAEPKERYRVTNPSKQKRISNGWLTKNAPKLDDDEKSDFLKAMAIMLSNGQELTLPAIKKKIQKKGGKGDRGPRGNGGRGRGGRGGKGGKGDRNSDEESTCKAKGCKTLSDRQLCKPCFGKLREDGEILLKNGETRSWADGGKGSGSKGGVKIYYTNADDGKSKEVQMSKDQLALFKAFKDGASEVSLTNPNSGDSAKQLAIALFNDP